MSSRELALRTMLRILVVVALCLGTAGFVLGFFPGYEVYRRDVFIETRDVVEHWNMFLGMLVLYLAPGAIIWRKPSIGYALVWSLWTMAVTMVVFVATFDLGDWSVRTVHLWPYSLFTFLMLALVFLLIAVIPIACGVFWWVTRDRVQPPALPTARVVKSRA
jgi:hypothetical protein